MSDEHVRDAREGFLAEDPESISVVASWVRKVLRSQWSLADAEALEQEVVLELITMGRDGRIRSDTDFRAFVGRVARVRAIDAYRSQKLRKHAPLSEIQDLRDDDSEPSPSVVHRRERAELARYIFQTLTPACRQLLRWLLAEERSHAWIAGQLDINEGAARVRAHRCIDRARKISKRFTPVLRELST